ncbi:MAG: autotransporter domain-containing protein, partial [Opitutaceae bacterium]|nr:autotransporter domain-containing protein [Opitutaceae bacterium]
DIILDNGGNYLRVEGSHVGTVSGNISGPGYLVKQGGGMLRLTGSNSFAGEMQIHVGTLAIDNAWALGSHRQLVFAGGALLAENDVTIGKRIVVQNSAGGTILNGSRVTITGASPAAGSGQNGAGLYLDVNSSFNAEDVTFLRVNNWPGGDTAQGSPASYAGAVYMVSSRLNAKGAQFIGNTTNRTGAAIFMSRDNCELNIIDASFYDNINRSGWRDGGAISASGGNQTIIMGASAGRASVFSGNKAGTAPDSPATSLHFGRGANKTITVNVITGPGGTLDMSDPMASQTPDAANPMITVNFTKTGPGAWKLGGGSLMGEGARATVNINEGVLSLHDNASWQMDEAGSFVAVNDGGVLHLSTSSTINITSAANAGVTINPGGTLLLAGAAGAAVLKAPLIDFKDGSTIGFDAGASATKLHLTGGGTLAFGNINIDLNPIATGNAGDITLLDTSGFTGDKSSFALEKFTLTLRGESIGTLDNPRLRDAALALDGGTLQASYDFQGHATVTWTGAAGAGWDASAANWSGALDAPASGTVSQFFHGDHVVFDSAADAGAPANRSITIAAGGAGISGMTVQGDGNYTFTGGPIDGDGTLLHNGSGTVALNNANDYAGGTVISADGTLIARHANSLGAGTVQNDGLLVFDIARDNGGTLSNMIGGEGVFEKTGDGEIVMGGNLATATLVSAGTFRAARDNIFTSSKPVSIATGATLALSGCSQTIANLANRGLIDFGYSSTTDDTAARATPVTLNVTGPYSGGGALRMLVHLAGADSWADSLHIEGPVDAGGKTTVNLVNASKTPNGAPSGGLALITAPGAAPDDAFELGSTVGTGFYLFSLHPELLDNNIKTWTLHNAGYSLAMGFNTAARLAWQASLQTLLQRQGEFQAARSPGRQMQFWSRFSFRGDNVSMPEYDALSIQTSVAQGGVDLISSGSPEKIRWSIGLLADYTHSNFDLVREARGNASIHGAGIYMTAEKNGGYVHFLGKVMRGVYELSSTDNRLETDSRGVAVSLELGKSMEFSQNVKIAPQIQADVFSQDIKNAGDSGGLHYEFDTAAAWRFRAGMRLDIPFSIGGRAAGAYARVSAVHAAQADDRITVMGNTGVENLKGTSGVFEGGFQTGVFRGQWSWLYANASWETGDKIDSYAFTGGLKFAW